jgi:hypothetical protein
MELKFKFPDADAPGYLRRQHKIQQIINGTEGDPQIFEKMVDLLLEFVVKPEDEDKAREMIWELSEKEYSEAMAGIQEASSVPKNK